MSTINCQSVNTNYYVPIQPGLKINTGCYIELKPTSNSTNQNIVLFHQFRLDNPSIDWLPVLPDGCIEIVFCCNPNNPTAYIYSSLLQKKHLYFQTGYDHFGIRFLPEHGFKILSYSMRELVDCSHFYNK